MAFLALLALAALDAAGYSVIAPVVPAVGEETNTGPTLLGTLVASFAVGQLVGFPLAGRIAARRSAAAVLALSLVAVAVGDLAFVLGDGIVTYFAARFAQGVGAAGLWIGVTFAVLERYPGSEYARLTAVLAAYSVGGVAGPALGAVGGVSGPFILHLALTTAALAAVALLGRPEAAPQFTSDRTPLRSLAFAVACAGILLVAAGYGALEGALPLHFATRLSQAEIAFLLVGASIALGVAATVAGRVSPRAALAAAVVPLPAGVFAAGAADSVAVWAAALVAIAVGLGAGEAGALGILLDRVGVERIVVALVVWSQVWAVGYLGGPVLAGALADAAGFAWVGLVPLAFAIPVVVGLVATSGARSAVTASAPGGR